VFQKKQTEKDLVCTHHYYSYLCSATSERESCGWSRL